MKKLIKFTGLFLTAMMIAISAYYIFVVVNAKAYTHATILKDLKKSQWRSPEGAARKFEIRSQDLSKRQKEILIKVTARL